jgi:hypothetical protein
MAVKSSIVQAPEEKPFQNVSQLDLLHQGPARQEAVAKRADPGNTKGGSITLPLTSCLSGLESAA